MKVLPQASEAQILSMYRRAAKDLSTIIQKAKTTGTYFQYRLAQLHAIQEVIQELDANSKDWVKENIPAVMQTASDAVKEDIANQDESDFSFRFAGVPQDVVKIMTHQSFLDFGNTTALLGRNGQRAALNKIAIQRKIVQGTIQGGSPARTQADILAGLTKDIKSVQYQGGAKVPIEAYINMLVRTQTMNAYNVAASQQMLQAGRMFGIFPTIPALNRPPDDPCWAWEKKKYVNLLTDPLPPASTHPNCRHTIQPISFAQLKAERPDLYEQALAYFNKTAG